MQKRPSLLRFSVVLTTEGLPGWTSRTGQCTASRLRLRRSACEAMPAISFGEFTMWKLLFSLVRRVTPVWHALSHPLEMVSEERRIRREHQPIAPVLGQKQRGRVSAGTEFAGERRIRWNCRCPE